MKKQKLLSTEELASFCSQTSLLFQAGIPPVESMYVLLNDMTSEKGRELLESILKTCRQGDTFYEALKATGVFPNYVLHTVKLGEISGNLDVCMTALATYYEKENNIFGSIKSAITYPLLMIVMMIIIIFVLISKVMPIFNQVFIELGSEMSGFAASLLHMGETLNKYSVVFLIILAVLFVVYAILSKTSWGRKAFTYLLGVFPLTKGFFDSVSCQRFASGMAMCLGSGMDTYVSLDIVAQLVGNKKMTQKIENCKKSLLNGSNLAEALYSSNIFNNLFSQMVAVGFKSGKMDIVLSKISDSYEKITDKKIQSMISVLEPTLVIILSIIVGLILLSVILPLMGIMSSIG